MRVVLLGSGAFALPTLRWLGASEHEVPLVVTQPARRGGRGRRVLPTPVRAGAEELGFETLEARDVNAADVVAALRSTRAQLGLVIAYGQKLGPEVLTSMPGGCLNLHASLLPQYRGAAPINWAILRGESETGCTVFRITERMDAGPILTIRRTAIRPQETAGELHDRLAEIGLEAVRDALGLFDGGAAPKGTPQDESRASCAPKLKKPDGFIVFDRPAADVARHVCGMTPWPGAAARYVSPTGRTEPVLITRARRVSDPSAPTMAPGVIDEHRYVAARDGFVELLEIQPSSGRNMTWREFVNGRHVKAGDRFMAPEAPAA